MVVVQNRHRPKWRTFVNNRDPMLWHPKENYGDGNWTICLVDVVVVVVVVGS